MARTFLVDPDLISCSFSFFGWRYYLSFYSVYCLFIHNDADITILPSSLSLVTMNVGSDELNEKKSVGRLEDPVWSEPGMGKK